MIEKRKELRAGTTFPVSCNTLSNRNYFYTVCRDLSSEGAKIITDNFIPSGDSMQIDINLITKVINLKAKVMWCNKERYSDRYSAGLMFTELTKQARDQISNFLISTAGNNQ